MDSRSPGASFTMSAVGLLSLQHDLSVSPAGVPGQFFTELVLPTGVKEKVNIDTGSVGIVIPHTLVVDASGNYYPWAEPTGGVLELIYEPSGDTISGPVVRLSGLTLGDGSIAIGPVRALAYTQGSGTYMLGVGFGLEAKSQWLTPPPNAGGGAAALCLDNPFLAIEGMSRTPGAAFQAAYTLSAAGGASPSAGSVTFGQTPDSITGFRFLSLTADPNSPSGFQLPWIDVAVTPQGQAPLPVTRAQLLMDAGIPGMFLGVFQPSPPASGASSPVATSWPGARIAVSATDAAGAPVLQYAFTDANPQLDRTQAVFWNTDPNETASPSAVLHGGPSPQGGSFINTGVHVLARYDYHFDAVNARVGFRPRTGS